MKTTLMISLICAVAVFNLFAQTTASSVAPNLAPVSGTPQDTPYSIVQRDANSSTWQRTTYEQLPSGEWIPHVHSYEEIATGMHYKDPQTGAWLESNEQIDIASTGGARAIHGQHQVFFPADIYDGIIELVTPDGKHLKSRPLGISYYDGSNSVLIAELKHSIGQILPSGNQVIYTNAFTDFAADLLLTYRKSGFESDLVFREQPPAPEAFGLSSEGSQIELFTEFFGPPEPKQIAAAGIDGVSQDGSKIDLPDSTLNFGTMAMIHGNAFSMGSRDSRGLVPASQQSLAGRSHPGDQIPVSKTWTQMDGRTFLIESVPVRKIGFALQTLPIPVIAASGLVSRNSVLRHISATPFLPPRRTVQVSTNAIRLAKAAAIHKVGVVLDYNIINVNTNNVVFQGDSTYFISGWLFLGGSNVIEGGTVIKFSQTNACGLNINGGTVTCLTAPYRSAIFTSLDDNTVGETISGSSGSPVTDSQNYYLSVYFNGAKLHDLRMLYCYSGVSAITVSNADLSDIQFVHAAWPIWFSGTGTNSSFSARNVLMTDVVGSAFEAYGNVDIEHLTLDSCAQLGWNDGGANLYLTNCLLTGVQSMGDIPHSTNLVAILSTNTGIFQAVGGGSYYLATNSPYRDVGTTNIGASLLAELAKKTTYPPFFYSNIIFSVDTMLSPQIQRDSDVPDLGYHYDPIDYLVDDFWITNASLTISPGTVVACCNDSGLVVTGGATINSVGTPIAPVWLTRYSSVQEESVALGVSPANPSSGNVVNSWHSTGEAPIGYFRFSKFSCPADGGIHLYSYDAWTYSNLIVQDCEFWGGQCNFGGSNSTVTGLKNDLFARVAFTASASGYTNNFLWGSNNLFWSASVAIVGDTNNWAFFNNEFYNTSIFGNRGRGMASNGYNAYIVNTNRMLPTDANDVLTNGGIAFQGGPLGDFYQPTNSILIDVGSCTADVTGLYHYTTTTNEVKEANSTVDIGYHYVAVDSSGNAIDTDGDGVPDYQEDANGNGVVDSGETDWQSASDLGLKVLIIRPRNNSIIP